MAKSRSILTIFNSFSGGTCEEEAHEVSFLLYPLFEIVVDVFFVGYSGQSAPLFYAIDGR